MASIFEESESLRWGEIMKGIIEDLVPPIALRNPEHQYWMNTRVSEEFMEPALDALADSLRRLPLLRKRNYHQLVDYLDPSEISQDVVDVLDGIAAQASKVKRV